MHKPQMNCRFPKAKRHEDHTSGLVVVSLSSSDSQMLNDGQFIPMLIPWLFDHHSKSFWWSTLLILLWMSSWTCIMLAMKSLFHIKLCNANVGKVVNIINTDCCTYSSYCVTFRVLLIEKRICLKNSILVSSIAWHLANTELISATYVGLYWFTSCNAFSYFSRHFGSSSFAFRARSWILFT